MVMTNSCCYSEKVVVLPCPCEKRNEPPDLAFSRQSSYILRVQQTQNIITYYPLTIVIGEAYYKLLHKTRTINKAGENHIFYL